MEAYRDQYATLFNNGRNVAVIGISVDADTTLASWARDEFSIPFEATSAEKWRVFTTPTTLHAKTDTRTLFVIDPTGSESRHPAAVSTSPRPATIQISER